MFISGSTNFLKREVDLCIFQVAGGIFIKVLVVDFLVGLPDVIFGSNVGCIVLVVLCQLFRLDTFDLR